MPWLKIDRSHVFDPVPWLGAGWKLKEQYPDSFIPTEVDLEKVTLISHLSSSAGHIPLDAMILEALKLPRVVEEEAVDGSRIPTSWKRTVNRMPLRIFFSGTVLEDSEGASGCLYLKNHLWERQGRGCWKYGVRRSLQAFSDEDFFAVF